MLILENYSFRVAMLDEIDIKILSVIQKNAGLPLSEISRKVIIE